MIYDKPPISIDQQIQLLESRGMNVPSHARAAHYLCHIGYYRLSAYWLPFEHPGPAERERSHTFVSGTSFDDVLDRYVFDRHLRILMLEALERVEVSLRACWVNSFTLKHGAHAYLDARHFNCGYQHAEQLARVASDLKKSNEVFVEHYRGKYRNPALPPMWVMAETVTFGALSKWIQITRDTQVQEALSDHLYLPTIEIVHGVLHNLSLLRNVCAHHGRLWNRRFAKKYPHIKKLPDLIHPNAPQEKARYLYNHLVVLRHLMLRINPGTSWPRRLRELLDRQTEETLSAMHLPEAWADALQPNNAGND